MTTAFGIGAVDAAAADELTFAVVWTQARDRSLDGQRAALAGRAATAAAALAEAATDPTLSVTAATGLRYRERPAPGVDEHTTREQSYGLRLGWSVYDFGRTAATRRRHDETQRATELEKKAVAERLYWRLARLYQAAVHGDRLVAATSEQVAISERKLAEVRRSYQQGVRAESDVLAAEVDLGRARVGHADADASARAARVNLAEHLAMPDGTPFRLARPPIKTPAEIDRIAQGWRPGGAPTSEAVRAAERAALSADIEGARADRRPTLSLAAQLEEAGSWQPLSRNASTQLQLSWEIPWSGRSRLVEEQVGLKAQAIELASEAERIERRTLAALGAQQLEAAQERWLIYERQLELAERQHRLIENRYRAGNASALELSGSEAAVAAARLDRVRLSNVATMAAIDLAEARGLGPESQPLEPVFQ